MKGLEEKLHLKNALERLKTISPTMIKKELYRVLLIAKREGWEVGSRKMYGGGTAIGIWEVINNRSADFVTVCVMGEDVQVDLDESYFKPDFELPWLPEFNPELEAELRNEEALYKYELPRPWNTEWMRPPYEPMFAN